MSPSALDELLRTWLRDDTVQTLLLLLCALLAAFASIASFVFGDSRGASPTRLELGLLVFSVFLTWFVALQSGG